MLRIYVVFWIVVDLFRTEQFDPVVISKNRYTIQRPTNRPARHPWLGLYAPTELWDKIYTYPATSLTISLTKSVLFEDFPFVVLIRCLTSRDVTLWPFLRPRARPINQSTCRLAFCPSIVRVYSLRSEFRCWKEAMRPVDNIPVDSLAIFADVREWSFVGWLYNRMDCRCRISSNLPTWW